MNGGSLLLAYHGCDATVRDDLVTGTLASLKPSENRYDWLGPGIYFYEGDCQRARQFAQASHDHPQRYYTKKPIGTPSVVGAVLRISTCLDMTTQDGLLHYRAAYETLQEALAGKELPQNLPAGDFDTDVILHHLDEAVFRTVHAMRAREGLEAFQVVRGAFYQGAEQRPRQHFVKAPTFSWHCATPLASRAGSCLPATSCSSRPSASPQLRVWPKRSDNVKLKSRAGKPELGAPQRLSINRSRSRTPAGPACQRWPTGRCRAPQSQRAPQWHGPG